MIELYADDEEDFVEKSLNTPRPCTVWMRGDFSQLKIDEIFKRGGICFIGGLKFPKDDVISL